jgi:tetratricopeptide (TPR) repeat protein
MVTVLRQSWVTKPIWGIPLSIELSFFLPFVVCSLLLSQMAAVTGLWLGLGKGILIGLVLFASLLMHEVCRAIAGRFYGMTVQSITLKGSGITTFFQRPYQNSLQLMEVSFAGSLFNLSLFVLLSGLAKFPLNLGESVLTLVDAVKVINVTIGLFYIIPGVPLDGAQVLRALLWQKSKKEPPAPPWLMRVGYAASAIAIAAGIYYMGQHAIVGVVLLYLGLWACITHPETVLPKLRDFTGQRKSQSSRRMSTSKQKPRQPSSPRSLPPLPQIADLDAQFLSCAEPTERFNQGMHYVENQKFQAAITIFAQVIQANPACAEAFHNRGSAYLRVGDFPNALEDFKKALRRGLHHHETYVGEGLAYVGSGDRQGGIMAYSEALRLNEKNLRAYVNRGNAYVLMGQHQKAIADYQQAEQCFVEPWEQESLVQIRQALALLNYDNSVQANQALE